MRASLVAVSDRPDDGWPGAIPGADERTLLATKLGPPRAGAARAAHARQAAKSIGLYTTVHAESTKCLAKIAEKEVLTESSDVSQSRVTDWGR